MLCQRKVFNGGVGVVDVGLVMLAVVKLQRAARHMRLEGIERVRQLRQFDHVDTSP
jgi:hypothetical protein